MHRLATMGTNRLWRFALLSRLIPALVVTSLLIGIPGQSSADEVLPACPEIFAHGGYPTGPDPWERDQVRQPNNPTALADYRARGAVGVEADVQLTRNGTKAVMWHNDTSNALTGSKAPINTLWWNAGTDKLNGRTLKVGPYQGEVVYTLRQYLDAIHGLDMVPLIEVKGAAKQSLLHSDTAIRDRAWSELLDPIAERIGRQEIMLYTHDAALKPLLAERATAAGLADVVAGGPHRPVWPDTVDWEEPPPSWQGNESSWQTALANQPQRIATDWPAELANWLSGRCQ